jgi:hypothetical protein
MKRISIGGTAVRHLDAWPSLGSALWLLVAAIVCVAIVSRPTPAHAAHGGGGGHGGGFHGAGFHGGGFGGVHSGGFGGGFHSGGFRNGYHGWHGGGYWGYDPYIYGSDDPLYDNQSTAPQSWYCTNPAGYYPYVTQCSVAWQPVRAD